ncbi:GDP-L-fucose synthase [compost metagenome]
MRILVLGGSYFIGLAIVEKLKELGEVTVLNRGTRPIPLPGIRSIRCDRRDAAGLESRLTEEYDVVVDISALEPKDIECVLRALKKKPDKYVFISSAAIYNRELSPLPFAEEAPGGGDPIWEDYGTLKYECEQMLSAYGLPRLFMIRPPYVYGPHNYNEREQFIWARLLHNRPVFVPGDGETLVQFCYVHDLADFVGDIVRNDRIEEGAYNIGESAYYSFNDYIRILGEISGTVPRLEYVRNTEVRARAYFPFRHNHFFLDVGKFKQIPGFRETKLQDGLRLTYDWFKTNGSFEYTPTETEAEWTARG